MRENLNRKTWYIERCVAECVWLRGDKKINFIL